MQKKDLHCDMYQNNNALGLVITKKENGRISFNPIFSGNLLVIDHQYVLHGKLEIDMHIFAIVLSFISLIAVLTIWRHIKENDILELKSILIVSALLLFLLIGVFGRYNQLRQRMIELEDDIKYLVNSL